MVQQAKGWYPDPDDPDRLRFWTGRRWDNFWSEVSPNGDEAAPAGWYLRTGYYRWWSGSKWCRARSALDGHVSVAEDLGQALLYITPPKADLQVQAGGVVENLFALLRNGEWPPVRVTQMTPVAAGSGGVLVFSSMSAIAIVEWDGPDRTPTAQ